MSYLQVFLAAVPTANKQAYAIHAQAAALLFKEYGATRIVECWGEDVPAGTLNDLQTAVKAKPDETVILSWIAFPDRETRDNATEKVMADPRVEQIPEMPFDGKRAIFAGFSPLLDTATNQHGAYVDGCFLPAAAENKTAYLDHARLCADIFMEQGALRVIETWADNIPEGQLTDYHRALLLKSGEGAVFSCIEWPSREARDAGWEKIMADERMPAPSSMPFDGARMIYGSFSTLIDL